MNLKGKKILITAGPTWVKIDNVRVISNKASGETGIILAEKLLNYGAKVTLLLGPVTICCLDKRIRLIPFNYFEELEILIKKELKERNYDAVIHSAAVSDYKPEKSLAGKIRSDLKSFSIKLVPTKKLIGAIKKMKKSVFLVGFKFEPNVNKSSLLKESKTLIKRANLDLAVANTIINNSYSAYVVDKSGASGKIISKQALADKLIKRIGEHLCPS